MSDCGSTKAEKSPGILAVAFTACLTLSACGRSGSKGEATGTASDPIAANIRTDVETPILFAISSSGITTLELDNGRPSAWTFSSAGIVSGGLWLSDMQQYPVCPPGASGKGHFQYRYVPSQKHLAGYVLHSQENVIFIRQGGYYRPSSKLLNIYRFRWTANGCAESYFPDLGHLHVTTLRLVNTFDGPDRRTGATTKIKSYKVVAEFQPSYPLTTIAPNVPVGRFEWPVAMEKNPMTAEWELYQLGKLQWSP